MRKIPISDYEPYTVKIAEILLFAGECSKEEIELIFDNNKRRASTYLYTHNHVFKTVKRQYKRKVLRYVRPILNKKDETPFSLLLKAMDDGKNLAKTYYIETMWKNGRLNTNESKGFRNSCIAHTAALLYDHYDIRPWARKTLLEMAEDAKTIEEMNRNLKEGEKAKAIPLIPQNTLYTTSEIKWFSKSGKTDPNEKVQTYEYRNSISTGTLVCESGTYVIYALYQRPNNTVNWNEGTESRYLTQVNNVFRYLPCSEINKRVNNLMLIGNAEIAKAVCEAQLSTDEEVKGLKLPDDIDKSIFVPDDLSAKEIIEIFSIPDYQQKLRDYYVPDKRDQFTESKTEDGIVNAPIYDSKGQELKDENGKVLTEEKELLLWFDNDLNRLCAALNKTERSIKKLMIYCLESQSDLLDQLRRLSRNTKVSVSISSVEFEDIIGIIKTKGEEEKNEAAG